MQKAKVILGMSGGTDSSVSALLLQEQGYEVIGATFRFYDTPDTPIHIADAQNLAHKIGIEHQVYDFRKEFESSIVRYFIDEYMAGRTPSPCVKCNNEIKFRFLEQIAQEKGANYIATGHYVQIEKQNNTHYICSGNDPDKDQSFFLWGLTQGLLQKTIFPLGKFTKKEVRQLAAERGFVRAATKKDSLGVCFCPGDYRSFLKQNVAEHLIKKGTFYNTNNQYVGEHLGYPFYTVGQRRGLGIYLNQALFVKEIIPQQNAVILASKAEMFQQTIEIKGFNCQQITDFENKTLICKIRYRKQATPCHVELKESHGVVFLHEPLDAIAPGQTAVFYQDNKVVGGGWIV